MAEKEGFEPSIPFWGIHDFQSCALGQLRDFSIRRSFNRLSILLHLFRFVKTKNTFFLIFYGNAFGKNLLTFFCKTDIITSDATVAQSVEQLIRNQQAAGSSPASSSKKTTFVNDKCGFFIVKLLQRKTCHNPTHNQPSGPEIWQQIFRLHYRIAGPHK